MQTTIRHKHGASFRAEIAATVQGDPLDLTGMTITSQIRAAAGSYRVPGVVVDVVDAANGLVVIHAKDTTQWPVTKLEWDVRMIDADGNVSATDTVLIDCEREVTR